ncbi:MAG: hypothetical protein MHM6MM_000133 [Cercozoa sp. M6MM]
MYFDSVHIGNDYPSRKASSLPAPLNLAELRRQHFGRMQSPSLSASPPPLSPMSMAPMPALSSPPPALSHDSTNDWPADDDWSDIDPFAKENFARAVGRDGNRGSEFEAGASCDSSSVPLTLPKNTRISHKHLQPQPHPHRSRRDRHSSRHSSRQSGRHSTRHSTRGGTSRQSVAGSVASSPSPSVSASASPLVSPCAGADLPSSLSRDQVPWDLPRDLQRDLPNSSNSDVGTFARILSSGKSGEKRHSQPRQQRSRGRKKSKLSAKNNKFVSLPDRLDSQRLLLIRSQMQQQHPQLMPPHSPPVSASVPSHSASHSVASQATSAAHSAASHSVASSVSSQSSSSSRRSRRRPRSTRRHDKSRKSDKDEETVSVSAALEAASQAHVRFNDADNMLRRAFASARADHMRLRVALQGAEAARRSGYTDKARLWFRRAVALRDSRGGNVPRRLASVSRAWLEWAKLEEENGDFSAALVALLRGLRVLLPDSSGFALHENDALDREIVVTVNDVRDSEGDDLRRYVSRQVLANEVDDTRAPLRDALLARAVKVSTRLALRRLPLGLRLCRHAHGYTSVSNGFTDIDGGANGGIDGDGASACCSECDATVCCSALAGSPHYAPARAPLQLARALLSRAVQTAPHRAWRALVDGAALEERCGHVTRARALLCTARRLHLRGDEAQSSEQSVEDELFTLTLSHTGPLLLELVRFEWRQLDGLEWRCSHLSSLPPLTALGACVSQPQHRRRLLESLAPPSRAFHVAARRLWHCLHAALEAAPRYGPLWQEALELCACDVRLVKRLTESALAQVGAEIAWKVRARAAWIAAWCLQNVDVHRSDSPALSDKSHLDQDRDSDRERDIMRYARRLLRDAEATAPKNLRWRIALLAARVEAGQRNFAEARRLTQRALQSVGKRLRAVAVADAARLEHLGGDVERSESLLRSHIENDGSDWRLHRELVGLLLRMRRPAHAALALAQALHSTGECGDCGRLWALAIEVARVPEAAPVLAVLLHDNAVDGDDVSDVHSVSSVSSVLAALNLDGDVFVDESCPIDVPLLLARRALCRVPKSGEVWLAAARLAMCPAPVILSHVRCTSLDAMARALAGDAKSSRSTGSDSDRNLLNVRHVQGRTRFSLRAAARCLDCAAEFTPQCGDVALEKVRWLALLHGVDAAGTHRCVQALGWQCAAFSVNYGAVWLRARDSLQRRLALAAVAAQDAGTEEYLVLRGALTDATVFRSAVRDVFGFVRAHAAEFARRECEAMSPEEASVRRDDAAAVRQQRSVALESVLSPLSALWQFADASFEERFSVLFSSSPVAVFESFSL